MISFGEIEQRRRVGADGKSSDDIHREALRRLTASMRMFSWGMKEAADAFYAATERFGKLTGLLVAEERSAKLRYAVAHGGRLPGSERTARLRKKRRDAVLRWWRDQ